MEKMSKDPNFAKLQAHLVSYSKFEFNESKAKYFMETVLQYVDTVINLAANKGPREQIKICRLFDVLQDVVTKDNQVFFIKMIARKVFDILIEEDINSWCVKKELLKTFLICVQNSSKNVRKEAVKGLPDIYLFKIVDSISTYGDYDFQVTLIEVVFRMYGKTSITSKLKDIIPESEELSQSFANINGDTFDEDVRKFLNILNKNSGKVFSIICDAVFVGNTKCGEPMEDINGLWVDFNLSENAISWYCTNESVSNSPEEADALWNLLMFFVSDVESVQVHRPSKTNKILILIKLKMPCISTLDKLGTEIATADNVKLVVASNKTNSTSLLTKILPSMFKNKFHHNGQKTSLSKKSVYKPLSVSIYRKTKSESSKTKSDISSGLTAKVDPVNRKREVNNSPSECTRCEVISIPDSSAPSIESSIDLLPRTEQTTIESEYETAEMCLQGHLHKTTKISTSLTLETLASQQQDINLSSQPVFEILSGRCSGSKISCSSSYVATSTPKKKAQTDENCSIPQKVSQASSDYIEVPKIPSPSKGHITINSEYLETENLSLNGISHARRGSEVLNSSEKYSASKYTRLEMDNIVLNNLQGKNQNSSGIFETANQELDAGRQIKDASKTQQKNDKKCSSSKRASNKFVLSDETVSCNTIRERRVFEELSLQDVLEHVKSHQAYNENTEMGQRNKINTIDMEADKENFEKTKYFSTQHNKLDDIIPLNNTEDLIPKDIPTLGDKLLPEQKISSQIENIILDTESQENILETLNSGALMENSNRVVPKETPVLTVATRAASIDLNMVVSKNKSPDEGADYQKLNEMKASVSTKIKPKRKRGRKNKKVELESTKNEVVFLKNAEDPVEASKDLPIEKSSCQNILFQERCKPMLYSSDEENQKRIENNLQNSQDSSSAVPKIVNEKKVKCVVVQLERIKSKEIQEFFKESHIKTDGGDLNKCISANGSNTAQNEEEQLNGVDMIRKVDKTTEECSTVKTVKKTQKKKRNKHANRDNKTNKGIKENVINGECINMLEIQDDNTNHTSNIKEALNSITNDKPFDTLATQASEESSIAIKKPKHRKLSSSTNENNTDDVNTFKTLFYESVQDCEKAFDVLKKEHDTSVYLQLVNENQYQSKDIQKCNNEESNELVQTAEKISDLNGDLLESNINNTSLRQVEVEEKESYLNDNINKTNLNHTLSTTFGGRKRRKLYNPNDLTYLENMPVTEEMPPKLVEKENNEASDLRKSIDQSDENMFDLDNLIEEKEDANKATTKTVMSKQQEFTDFLITRKKSKHELMKSKPKYDNHMSRLRDTFNELLESFRMQTTNTFSDVVTKNAPESRYINKRLKTKMTSTKRQNRRNKSPILNKEVRRSKNLNRSESSAKLRKGKPFTSRNLSSKLQKGKINIISNIQIKPSRALQERSTRVPAKQITPSKAIHNVPAALETSSQDSSKSSIVVENATDKAIHYWVQTGSPNYMQNIIYERRVVMKYCYLKFKALMKHKPDETTEYEDVLKIYKILKKYA